MSRTMRRPPPPGFTLIELMIVVAVIVILGTVAVPSYNEYIRGVHRADARAGLLQAQQWPVSYTHLTLPTIYSV